MKNRDIINITSTKYFNVMENVNTYRAIITGMILLFAGCVVVLVISRETINTLNTGMNQLKLKNESMLSEKLLIQKSLDKQSLKNQALDKQKQLLEDSLKSSRLSLGSLRISNRDLSQTLSASRRKQKKQAEKISSMKQTLIDDQKITKRTEEANRIKTDSISTLLAINTALRQQCELAATRTIDHVLIFAASANNKFTVKAKRARKLVARVDVPADFINPVFVLTAPDGNVVNNEDGLVARELVTSPELTASIGPTAASFNTKTMEVVYQPRHKLKAGTYVLQVRDGDKHVGSVMLLLDPMHKK